MNSNHGRIAGWPGGFTLVELLVVISIIVLLTAMLIPALEQAVYRARLSTCMGQLRVIGSAVTDYAMDHGSWYPYNRAHAPDVRQNWQASMLRHNNPDWAGDVDMRPVLRRYIPDLNKVMNDPLTHEPVDVVETDAQLVHGSYSQWFGWAYIWEYPASSTNLGRPDGAFKIGRRFSHTWDWDNARPTFQQFDALAGDFDRVNPSDYGSHPDHPRPRLRIWKRQDGTTAGGTKTITLSVWIRKTSGVTRGLLDTNFAYQDLSVRQFNGVDVRDDRMARIPEYNNGSSTPTNDIVQIPRQ
jgi:prepilin-type N-terminal cleavage/methylation domain-containing protein